MQIFLNTIISAFIYFTIGFSIVLIYNSASFIKISLANTLSFGAYLLFILNQEFVTHLYFCLILAIISTIMFDLFSEVYIFRLLRKKNISSFFIMLASLGVYIIIQNIISVCFGNDTKILRAWDVTVGHEIWGAYITDIQIITIVVSALCVGLSMVFLKYTKVGRRIRAVSANSELANVQGINSDRVILWATGIGSGMAAIAGILVGFDTGLTPTMGFNLLLYGIVAMIIGGVGSTKGLIGGAFLLAAAQHLTAYYIDSKWMNAITYIILIAFLIWRPLGFSGQRLKKIEI